MIENKLLRFIPIYQERVWGGRWLAEAYGRILTGNQPIGESWELVDREEVQSIVSEGGYKGISLQQLWHERREKVFGKASSSEAKRFPLLIKLLDASKTLSLQVHPPASVAAQLGGEPKTEAWYFLETLPEAEIFAGLKKGVTRERFVAGLTDQTVANCFHHIRTRPNDCMFLPSGRVHGIGAGNLILEVQQNSDTTYRVYDWGRLGLDGKPRPLHIAESLKCIDFNDIEPSLESRQGELRVKCPYFKMFSATLEQRREWNTYGESFILFFISKGTVSIQGESIRRGELVMAPASWQTIVVIPKSKSCEVVWITW